MPTREVVSPDLTYRRQNWSFESVDWVRFPLDETIGRNNGQAVADLLEDACRFRGYPSMICIDQGPEFSGRSLYRWAHANNVTLVLIQAGKPTQNA